ncbi:unnamed protein product, partial [Ranitomeya imitator]
MENRKGFSPEEAAEDLVTAVEVAAEEDLATAVAEADLVAEGEDLVTAAGRGGFGGRGRGGFGDRGGRGGFRSPGRGGPRGGRGGRGRRERGIRSWKESCCGATLDMKREGGRPGDQETWCPESLCMERERISVEDGELKTEYRAWNPLQIKAGGSHPGWCRPNSHKNLDPKSCISEPLPGLPCPTCLTWLAQSGRDLINVAKKRTNIIPVIEDARHPHKYRMLLGMVDVIFADVAQPDQTRIVALNAHNFLKNGGHFVISIK